jgi:site-specific recombinase XerD
VTYKRKVGINDKRKTWHCFRHTFSSALKLAGARQDIRRELLGQADNSAGAAYEHNGSSIQAKKETIELLAFDCFDARAHLRA